jgi:hypothetical protein
VRITCEVNGKVLSCCAPHAACAHVEADVDCHGCERKGPLEIVGTGNVVRGFDTYTTQAKTLCCGAVLGELRVTVSTIFGIEEDERVLNGRARVY